MSGNHQIIRDNIQPADIFLSRRRNSSVSETVGGVTYSKWSYLFLYIGEGKIIESDSNKVIIHPLDHYLNSRYDVGLFRFKEGLSGQDQQAIVKSTRKMLGIHNGHLQLFWRSILQLLGKNKDPDWSLCINKGVICTELVATVYQNAGKAIKKLPPHQMKPADFDNSLVTVRIA